MHREVRSRIVLNVVEPAELVVAVAVSGHYSPEREDLTVTLEGAPLVAEELPDAHRTRLHRIEADSPGELVIDYSARIEGEGKTDDPAPTDSIVYVRPSRYVESDSLAPTAGAEFAGLAGRDLLAAVSSWVGTRLAYVAGSSLPTDGAVRTLLQRQGVCRDFAHLTVALLRANNVPARTVAVYAPGLAPMDFHAVAEAWVDGAWQVVDATTLAPRSTLVRIATGRDAADTAFLTVLSGRVELISTEIGAVADTLPDDDVTQLVALR